MTNDQEKDAVGPETTPEAPDPRASGSELHTRDEDKVVAEIAAEDGRDTLDDLYDKESTPEEPMLVTGDEKHKWLAKLKSPKLWLGVAVAVIIVLIFVWLITPSRLWALNLVGQRAQVDIGTLVAATEGEPPVLKNAKVTVNNKDYQTDDHGKLRLNLPYGDTHIVVSKQGYESITKDELLDFDPFFHYLGGKQVDATARNLSFAMKSVGIPVKFTAKDWLTAQPIDFGKFSVGDVEAEPNTQGEVTMTVPATDAKTVQVQVKFGGTYADTAIELTLASKNQEFSFINAGKEYFISKRSGTYGVYSSNLDGSGVADVVAGSASETGDVAFSVSPSGKYGVLATTRDAAKDGFGSLQQKLYIVDLATNKLTAVDTALRFKLADWSGDTLVYATSEHSAGSAATIGRVASIDAAAAKQTTLASAGGITVARVSLGSAVYLTDTNELRAVKIKGGGDKSLGTGVSQLVQTDADRYAYQTADHNWHQYNANADQVTTATTPTSLSRVFLANPSADGQTQLVVDTVDGNLALIAKKVAGGQETKLFAGAGLSGPIRWVGNVAVYRVGSADYVVSPGGGQPKKITDVSLTVPNSNDYFGLN
jgi:hypothetical protein